MKASILTLLIFNFLSFVTIADTDFSNPDVIAKGGRLYDKWWAENTLAKPQTTHPAYPATAKKTGAATWRCKECHGWDYTGFKGAYGKGSHKTGIIGVSQAKDMSMAEILRILKNNQHRYGDLLPDSALSQIANFIKNGQVDISQYINKNTLQVKGDILKGKKFFNDSCKECHGSDGRLINFRSTSNPEYIGTVAVENPVEAIHKLRNGNPGAFRSGKAMPNMNKSLSLKHQLDLLAYLQTLPVK